MKRTARSAVGLARIAALVTMSGTDCESESGEESTAPLEFPSDDDAATVVGVDDDPAPPAGQQPPSTSQRAGKIWRFGPSAGRSSGSGPPPRMATPV